MPARAVQANSAGQDQASALGRRASGCLCPTLCLLGGRFQICPLHAAGTSTPPNSLWLVRQRAAGPVDHALHREAPLRCFRIRQHPTPNVSTANHLGRGGRAGRHSPSRSAQGHQPRASDKNDFVSERSGGPQSLGCRSSGSPQQDSHPHQGFREL